MNQLPTEVILKRFETPDETREMAKGRFEMSNTSLSIFLGANHYAK